MLKIELRNLKFHAYHGIHEKEKRTGGNFEINLVVQFQPANFPVLHLDDTIDYVDLFELVKRRMNKPTKLIETIATEIAEEVLNTYALIEEVEVEIKKLNPPIPSFNGYVAAIITKKRRQ